MKEENKKYSDVAYSIVKDAAEKIGSRLPGSDGEHKFHDYMAEKLREIGISKQKQRRADKRSKFARKTKKFKNL